MGGINAELFAAAADRAAGGVSWVRETAKSEPEVSDAANRLISSLCRLSYRSRSCSEVLRSPTTIGVFGASQAGKSYLVSSLAAGGSELTADWDGQRISFLQHINPQGGDSEATGVVTRFTRRDVRGPAGFPVEVRVFREIEVVMMLINSYFNDLALSNEDLEEAGKIFEPAAFEAHLKSCAGMQETAGGRPAVSMSDIVYMAEYLKKYARIGALMSAEVSGPLWSAVRDLAPALSLEGRGRLFSVFWGGLKVFDFLYEKIASELLKLEGCERIYVQPDAFVEEKQGHLQQRQNGTINAISSLAHLFDDDRELKVSLSADGSKTAVINFAALAAASLEITFPLTEGSGVSGFDVLDFPGARSRLTEDLSAFRKDEQNAAGRPTAFMIKYGSEFIRRGKVAYLIQRYNLRREIDVLLCCVNVSAQLEVSDLVEIVGEWISENVGRTPEARALTARIPLVCALTRFDQALSKEFASLADTGNPGAGILDKAFERFKAQTWMKEWRPGEPLRQFFLVRKPGMEGNEKWLTLDEATHQETGFNPAGQEKLATIRANVMANQHYRHMYPDGSSAAPFDAALSLNDGGVGYIAKFLSENFTGDRSIKDRLAANTAAEVRAVAEVLGKFASREGAGAMKQKREQGEKFARALLQCDEVACIFGNIREQTDLNERELAAAYRAHYVSGNNAERFAADVLDKWQAALADLSGGTAFEELAALLWRRWEAKRDAIMARSDAREQFAFFYDEAAGSFITGQNALKDRFRQLMEWFTDAVVRVSRLRAVDLRGQLVSKLSVTEKRQSLTMDTLALHQVCVARRIVSDFFALFGVLCFPEKPEMTLGGTPRRAFDDPDYNAPAMVSYGHPKISEELFLSQARVYHEDLLATLVQGVSSGESVDSRFNISAALNRSLCEILDVFDEAAAQVPA